MAKAKAKAAAAVVAAGAGARGRGGRQGRGTGCGCRGDFLCRPPQRPRPGPAASRTDAQHRRAGERSGTWPGRGARPPLPEHLWPEITQDPCHPVPTEPT